MYQFNPFTGNLDIVGSVDPSQFVLQDGRIGGQHIIGSPNDEQIPLMLSPSSEVECNTNGNMRGISIDDPTKTYNVSNGESIAGLINVANYNMDASSGDQLMFGGIMYNPTVTLNTPDNTGGDIISSLFVQSTVITNTETQTALGTISLLNVPVYASQGGTLDTGLTIAMDDSPTFTLAGGDQVICGYYASIAIQPTLGLGCYMVNKIGMWNMDIQGDESGIGAVGNSIGVWLEDQTANNVVGVLSEITAGNGRYFLNDTGGANSYFTGNVNFGNDASQIDTGGFFRPNISADNDAPNNSIYYSNDASKLVYKDNYGVVNPLY